MKILYGVVGEGMGHAIRSRVVLDHLVSRGHHVEIMTSGRARDFLSRHFDDVNRIHGFHLISKENRVRLGKTVWSNVLAGVSGVPRNIAAYFDLIEDFSPDVVISDFESWTYYYAKAHDLPIFSLDNMQIINRCRHPEAILAGKRTDFQVAKAFVKSKLPFCDHYLITTFFHPEVRKERTSLYPPILRPEILSARRERGDHLLVYQTGKGFADLVPRLEATGLECRIYGVRRDIDEDVVEGNLRYRPFSETGFVDDLAAARAVISSAGFTLLGEAVYLGVPMVAIPLDNQFEQTINARYLEHEGFGIAVENAAALARLPGFLAELARYEDALARYQQDGNDKLLTAVDEHLEHARTGAYD